MGGDKGVEDCQGCAVEHGRRLRELTSEREYGGDNAEEIGRGDLLRGKTQGYGARRSVRRIRAWESRVMLQR
jgi:hypothetical protein